MDLSTATWRKSSRSADNGAACVEVSGDLPNVIAIRDSKNPTGPALVVTRNEWRTLITNIKTHKYAL